MAYYGIPSAGLSLTATTAADTIVQAGQGDASALTIFGQEGNDIISFGAVGQTAIAAFTGSAVSGNTLILSGQDVVYTTGIVAGARSAQITGIVTSHAAARFLNTSEIRGNAGNDSIIFDANLESISGATLGGGQGNDYIGLASYVNGTFSTVDGAGAALALSGSFADAYLEGGDGNDTIYLNGTNAVYSALSANGNQGNDLVSLQGYGRLTGGSYIGLGQGNDNFSGALSGAFSSSVVGGLGNDTINFNATTGQAVLIGGDSTTDGNGTSDGNDVIFISGNSFDQSTVYGNGGNDVITLYADLSGSLVATHDGFDEVTADADIKDTTFQLGKQGDTFVISGIVNIDSATFSLGKGLDSFYLSGDVSTGAINATTINGGLGNDLILANATITGGGTVKPILQYADSLDSTLDGFDTIGVSIDDNDSGTFNFNYELGGLSQASFSGQGATGTNGYVVFSSTVSSDVTSRVDLISSNTSTGNVAVFQDGANNTYLFVDGGVSDDLVVQLGPNAVAALSGATIGVSVGKNLSVTLNY